MNVEIVNKRLLVSGKETDLKAEIFKHLIVGDFIVVVVGYLDGTPHTPSANVFLLNSSGRILWQIEEFTGVKGRSSYYSNVWMEEDGKTLHAYNPLGFDCIIDIETGKIKEYEFTK